MKKFFKKAKNKVVEFCKLCRADFEIKLQTIDTTPEKEEKMRKYFSHYCSVCKCPTGCSAA